MTDEQLLLASAYLDGDLDGATRTRAEADADVMAEVERQRVARDLLRDVAAPDPLRREQAITAALEAFGEEPATGSGASVPPPAPVPLPQRPRRAWWGLGAAAAAIVAVVAVGVVAALGGSSSDDEDTADDAGAAATVELGDQTLSATAQDDDGAPAAEEETASEATAAAAPAASEAAADTGGDAAGTTAALPRLATPDQLVEFAARPATDRTAEGAPTCVSDGRYVGRAIYDDAPVEIFTDGTTVTALDASTCAVVITVDV
jgi:hypothetical protein